MQIICPLVAIAIAGLIMAVRHGHGHRRSYLNYVALTSHQIGTDLTTKTNSELLVELEPGLRAELSDLMRAETTVAAMHFGDESPPRGNGKADSRLVLTNTLAEGLLIRLRVDSKANRFRILSYRTKKAPVPGD